MSSNEHDVNDFKEYSTFSDRFTQAILNDTIKDFLASRLKEESF